jgi:UDP-glucose 4-epimerase
VPEARNQIFNIGAETPVSVNTLAETVARVMGVSAEYRHVLARGEVRHAYCSQRKIERVLGHRSRTDIVDGLRRMAA